MPVSFMALSLSIVGAFRPSFIVGRAPNLVVALFNGFVCGLAGRFELVETFFENGLHMAIACHLIGQGSTTAIFQALFVVPLGQLEDAQAGTIAVLDRGFLQQNAFQEGLGWRTTPRPSASNQISNPPSPNGGTGLRLSVPPNVGPLLKSLDNTRE